MWTQKNSIGSIPKNLKPYLRQASMAAPIDAMKYMESIDENTIQKECANSDATIDSRRESTNAVGTRWRKPTA